MKLKYKLLILCAAFTLCALPFAFTGCSGEDETEFGEWITVTAPTCEEAGEEVRSALTDPLITETHAIPATGHDWGGWQTTAEPTCLLTGTETRTCNTCKNSDMRPIPALGHSWGDWETTSEADCEHDGAQLRICQRDETHTELNTIPATGHDYTDWVITLAPTCTAGGVETRYCRSDNKHTEARPLEAYGHNWGPYVETVPATCTEGGSKKRVCSNDSSHVLTYETKSRGHSFGDWVISVPATETEEGEDIRICRRDSAHTETRVAPAAGSSGLEYILNDAGTEYAVGADYPYPQGTVYIPAYHKGLPVTRIDRSAFQGCEDIEHIVFLGNNLKTVGGMAFAMCEKLQSIEFPEGITSVAAHAVTRCENLKSVSFPSTVKYLGLNGEDHGSYIAAVDMCPALESITVAEDNTAYKAENGCLIEKATNALLAGTVNAVIPDYVTKIERLAFAGSRIERINIPAKVSNIGLAAFNGCGKLCEVTFENGELKVLGGLLGAIFSGCNSLERIELPDSLTEINRCAFLHCNSLREIVFGKNLQKIGSHAFDGCKGIEICEIPASVTYIHGTSFSGSAVSSLTLAAGNTKYFKDGNCIIERETNTLVAGADDAVIPDYVTLIAEYAFSWRNMESVIIPAGVKKIDEAAFYECALLKNVSFETGSGLEVIGEKAFYNCTSLKGIMLPEKLREIQDSAFCSCDVLSSVTFGFSDGMFVFGASSLEIIGSYAFAYTALESFEVPATVTNIGDNAFRHCDNLTSLTVKDDNTAYKIVDGCLVENATGKVVYTPEENN